MDVLDIVDGIGLAIDVLGVVVMIGGILLALGFAAREVLRERGAADATYRRLRRMVGRSILLGLELLVAGDIIRTVAVAPTFTSVGVLAIIVAIRTFLSMTLEVEISNRWPWQRPSTTPAEGGIA